MCTWTKTPMRTKLVVGFFILTLFRHTDCAFKRWETGAGHVAWSLGCDFPNQDFSNVRSSGELCGSRCEQNPICTHFVWTNYNRGTCWLKHGLKKTSIWPYATGLIETDDNSVLCGFIYNR
ncbi:unnamed protein product [Rotaria magnacalcarata]|uniref:Apple domain-containing protein n=1 Tax=Rotaria magnacalcarata TaxID=392030 RepID=A0A814YEK5_9BILA|nr:unnamed protein product [Rotaria magnacalcarata]CAF1522214.1 unnamed protein product [Rotaria magnacalcarata]CAF2026790.1 unnamed protein product [Rotaria magnacalcarata]CAF2038403.1 unnamed protein product [Rotaria magnacalcarata]CAF2213935.1 unnamed protein product [Rotaria magnacalcarata]